MAHKTRMDFAPELLKNTQELATQVANRAKAMQKKSLGQDPIDVPEIPARSNDTPKAPEIPPKRMSFKKPDPELYERNDMIPLPQRNQNSQKAPPVPQKPASLQNSPIMNLKLKDKQNNSGLVVKPEPKAQVSLQQAPTAEVKMNNKKSFNPGDEKHFSKAEQSNTAKPDPTEEYGSEDALRGIESGLRNMERAMQEQMNLRSYEAAAAAVRQDHQRQQFNIMELKSNMRLMGSVTSLDGSQSMHGMENMRLNLDQQYNHVRGNGMERGISMDHMRLDNSMESNSNIRMMLNNSSKSNMADGAGQQHHFRSLDRHLPLEVQYGRQRSQEMEYIRQQLMPVIARNNEHAALNRQSGLSREDVRLRRRSSHDETQYSQQNNQGLWNKPSEF